ncbi:MAG TPA: hypothetical protein VF654_06815 [Pyrinomonadaceae bacterium]|jgi:hypothetical protein
MKKSTQRSSTRRVLRATGAADEPKGPTRGVRLPESLDTIVEGRTTPTLTRAAVIVDLIRKGLRYERLRQTKGDPALGELVALMDEMLEARLTQATTQIYKHVFIECLVLRKLLEEVLNDARVSSRAAERILTGRVLTPPHAPTGRGLEDFISECQEEAATVVEELHEEWQNEMEGALGIRPAPDAGPSPEHLPSPSAGQLPAPASATPDTAR